MVPQAAQEKCAQLLFQAAQRRGHRLRSRSDLPVRLWTSPRLACRGCTAAGQQRGSQLCRRGGIAGLRVWFHQTALDRQRDPRAGGRALCEVVSRPARAREVQSSSDRWASFLPRSCKGQGCRKKGRSCQINADCAGERPTGFPSDREGLSGRAIARRRESCPELFLQPL